eukprot:4511277-Prymnesium_polylepis.1
MDGVPGFSRLFMGAPVAVGVLAFMFFSQALFRLYSGFLGFCFPLKEGYLARDMARTLRAGA